MTEPVVVDIADGVATITINRPEARNALNRAVRRRLPAVITELEADHGVDVMILTGADPAFSAGVDLKEFGAGDVGGDELRSGAGAAAPQSVDMDGRSRDGQPPWRGALPPRTKLLIGAVNGVAVTGGLELALACDFLIASERARFADTHARVGVMPGWGLTVLLPQRVGVARAREMSVTGNFVDAALAYDWGLVNHVVPHDELLPYCRQLAADCRTVDQVAVRRMLSTYDRNSLVTDDEAWRIEDEVSRNWEGPGFDPAEIEKRRAGIMERGRSQTQS
ncbi:MAG: enoyl-CoA hydratase [Acidimicrobiia bacterium]|nr:enoyl-CoA hydratase [Acidimicrobiia bacterium]